MIRTAAKGVDMSVRRLPSGSFQARLMIDGLAYAETFATEQEARNWETVTRARALTGGLPKRITVHDYAARWMTTYDAASMSTRSFHQSKLDRHILPALRRRQVSDITPTDISRLVNDVRMSVSAATADAVYRTCSALFNAAVADDVIPRSPVRSKRHRPRRQMEPRAVLERHQARRLLAGLRGWHRDTALLQLALGARIGEIAGLTPHDVDLTQRRVTIRRRYYRGTVRATKNHRLRTLELPAITVPTIERLIREAGDVERLPPLDDLEHDAMPFLRRWLIQTSTGRPPNDSTFDKVLAAACADAGLPRISSHGLRHTYVSWDVELTGIVTDNGPQFIAKDFTRHVAALGLDHTRTPPRSPDHNAVCERLQGTVLQEFYRPTFHRGHVADIPLLNGQLQGWLERYNRRRPNRGAYMHGRTPLQVLESNQRVELSPRPVASTV